MLQHAAQKMSWLCWPASEAVRAGVSLHSPAWEESSAPNSHTTKKGYFNSLNMLHLMSLTQALAQEATI